MRRLTGAALIVAAFVSVGAAMINDRKQRLNALSALCSMLTYFCGEMETRLVPLRQAAEGFDAGKNENVSRFVLRVCGGLDALGDRSFREIWCAAADETLCCLAPDELAEIKKLGSTLGVYTLSEQLSALSLCRDRLERSLTHGRERLRDYKSTCMGVCSALGILLAVVLI